MATEFVPYASWYFIPLWTLLGMPFGLGILILALLGGALPTFVITVLLGRPLIALLRRAAARQTAYEDAPQTHQAKTGTPSVHLLPGSHP